MADMSKMTLRIEFILSLPFSFLMDAVFGAMHHTNIELSAILELTAVDRTKCGSIFANEERNKGM